jgi:FHS family Na+ dependent glucose MFS transporter 1
MTASTQDVAVPTGRLKIAQTVGYCVAFVALGLVAASLGPTISGLAAQTGTILSEISILFFVRALGYMLGSFFGGRLYDQVAGHPMMVGMLLLMAATMALVPVVPVLWLLVLVLTITGAAEGILDVGGNALLVWVHGSQVGPYMNALHFSFGVGAFLAPIIVSQIMLRSDGLGWPYWALALLMLPAALALLRLPSPQRETVSVQEAQDGDGRLLLVLFVAFFYLYVGAEVSFGDWVYTYSVEQGLIDEAAAAYLNSAFWGTFTVGRLLAIPIAARVRPGAILLGDLVLCLVSVAIILLWPMSVVVLWIGAMCLGLGLASVFPTMVSLAERRMTVTGKVAGWFLVGGSVGSMTLPWLIGQLFESVGPLVTLIAIGIDLLLALAVWVVLASGRRGYEGLATQ